MGRLLFELTQELNDVAAGKTFSEFPTYVALDGTGSFSISLVATDDLSPSGGTYTVSQLVDGVESTYQVVIPAGAPGHALKLEELVPSSPSLVYGVSFAQLNSAVAAAVSTALAGAPFVPKAQSYTMPSGNFTQWAVTPTLAGRAPFSSAFAGGTFGAVDDYTWSRGYNLDLLAGEGAFWDSLETHYFQAGPNNQIFERYWTWYTNDHTKTGRMLYGSVDQATGDATMIVNANGSGYINLIAQTSATDPAPTTFKLVPGGAQMFYGYPFSWPGAGPKNFISAQNNAGTLTHQMLSLDATDRLLLGSNGIVNVDDFAIKLAFFNNNPIVKQTALGPWGSSRASIVLSNLLASYGLINDSTVQPQKTLTYSASMTPDLSQGIHFDFTPTNGTAFTVNAPTSTTQSDQISIECINTFGVLGAGTFAAGYKLASAWSNPANGFRKRIGFMRNASTGFFYETWRTGDVPN